MTKEDKELIEEWVTKTSVSSGEVYILRNLIRKYIDPSCDICSTCPGQIRFAWIRLVEWWKLQNKNQWRFIKRKI
jgi:hypothetical protein